MSLKTNDLVKILSQSPVPQRPMSFDAAAFGLMIVFSCLTVLLLGLRPELTQFAPPHSFYIKTVLLFGFAICSMFAIRQAAVPAGKRVSFIVLLGMPFILGVLIYTEWMQTPVKSDIIKLFALPNFKACLIHVTLYGLGGMAFLTWLMKQYAPKNESVSAAMIGFSAAAFGAVGYSIHCPIDSPTFIAVAYGLPVLALTILGFFALPRFIRW